MAKKTILVVSSDVVGEKMAGPGIRYVEVARQLAVQFDVTLAAPEINGNINFGFPTITYANLDNIAEYISDFDFVFAQFLTYKSVQAAIVNNTAIIYDLYNPLPIEALVGNVPKTKEQYERKDAEYNELLNNLLLYSRSGSYFVCANERQRDFWIGYLAANRILTPSLFRNRKTEDLVGLLPFGLQDDNPVHKAQVLRNVLPGIDDQSFILLWAGGIWDWFDPLTAIKGMATLMNSQPKVKLVFLGTVHPNKIVGKMSMTDQAINLAKKLKVFGKNVFFIEGWVDYEKRSSYLSEANAAVSLHKDSLETRFSFRTRILDHFWADLPTVCTTGDWFAEVIDKERLGKVIPYGGVEEFVSSVTTLVTSPRALTQYRQNIHAYKERYLWKNTTKDIQTFIKNYRTEFAPHDEHLNYYIDIASLNDLKRDSRDLMEIKAKLQTYPYKLFSNLKK